MTLPTNEELGRRVREVWVEYAEEHGDTKPGHLTGWDELSEYDREVDRRIGSALRDEVLDALIAQAHRHDLLLHPDPTQWLADWLTGQKETAR